MRRDQADLEWILDVVRGRYVEPAPERFPMRLLTGIGHLVEYDSTSFNEIDPRHGRAVAVWSPDPLPVHPGRSVAELLVRFAQLADEQVPCDIFILPPGGAGCDHRVFAEWAVVPGMLATSSSKPDR